MRLNSPRWWRGGTAVHEQLDKKLIHSLSPGGTPSLKQLKYLGKVLTGRERRMIFILLVVACANVLFLSTRALARSTVAVPKSGGQYTEGLVGSPRTINPLLLQNNDSDRDLAALVYSGLVRYTSQREITPDLAERFEINPEGTAYTFFLRSGVVWHDDKPFTADDVVFTMTRIQDPTLKSPLYFSFKDVRVEKVDDTTVRFTLQKSFAPFLDLMTTGILPAHLWNDIPSESFALATLNIKPVGTGPWKFKTLQKNQDGTIRSYTISRNDTYFGKKSYLKTIQFTCYPDSHSAVNALKNRTVDGISVLPKSLKGKLLQDKDLAYYTYHLPQYTALFFNALNNPDLRSLAVRQALASMIDRDSLIASALAGEGERSEGPFLSEFFGGESSAGGHGTYNPSRAVTLLETAGWKRSDKGLWTKEDKGSKGKKRSLAVTITTINQEENIQVAELIKKTWMAGGVDARIQFVDPARVRTDVIDPRNYETLLYGEIIGSDPDPYSFWHSSQARFPGLNLASFSNTDADKLLEEARGTTDMNKRKSLYRKFQTIIDAETPAVFLYAPQYNYVVSKKIKGIANDRQLIFPSDRLIDSDSWYSKSKRTWKPNNE